MFKSAESLRLAAEMRALARVAAPWRESRTTWFDGTPESIEARIAATDRVLVFARAGYTEAHMALEREAAAARAELKEASHRLMVDFLDDGARAFKGSRRVAEGHPPLVHPDISFNNTIRYPDDKERNRFTLQNFRDVEPDETVEQRRQHPSVGIFNHDASELLTNGGAHHWASRRTADESTGFGDLGPGYEHFGDDDFAEYDDYLRRHDYHTDHRALEHRLAPGLDDDDPARYSHRRTAGDGPGLRMLAAEFVAAQGEITDRDELALRAARHADNQTGTWERTAAAQARALFVAAVIDEAPRARPRRTASAPAVLADFDDQLLFDS